MSLFSSFSTEMDKNRDTLLERQAEEHLSRRLADELSKLLPPATPAAAPAVSTNEERMMERGAGQSPNRRNQSPPLTSRRGRRRWDGDYDQEDAREYSDDESGHDGREHGGDVPVEKPEVTDRSSGVGLHALQEQPMCVPPAEYEYMSPTATDAQVVDVVRTEEPGAMAVGTTDEQAAAPQLPQPISLLNFINVWRSDLEQLLEPHQDPETAFCFLCEYGDENDLSGTSNPLITQLKKLFEGQLSVIDLQRRCSLVQEFYNRTFKSHCNHRVWHIFTIFRHFTRHTQCTAAQKELQLLAVLSAIERLTQKHIFFNTPEGGEVYSRAALSDLRALIQVFKSLT